MVTNQTPNEIDLETFLKSAGQSFTDAQKALVPGGEVPVNMMLSSAELELKASISSNAQGKMSIRPVSSEDIVRGGIDPGLLSTLRISFVSSIGEIAPQSVQTVNSTVKGNVVPVLVGRIFDEAAAMLKSGGWQFEPHAAKSEEIAAAGEKTRGRVLRQQPSAGTAVDKAKTTVQIWIDMGNIPVKEIEGIGIKLGDSLSKMEVTNVGELSLASASQVASALRIGESRAQAFVDMAGLMSRLAILGFKDQVVELLVKGANIRTLEQLANADPKELFRVCKEAITSGKVRVPREFTFTATDVKGWVTNAANYLGK